MKISQLPTGATPAGADLLPAVQSGATVQLTFAQLLTLIRTGLVSLSVSGPAWTPTISVGFSATPTIDASLGNVFEVGVLTGNITTLSITNPHAGQSIMIRYKQDGTGGRTVATPSGAKITGGVTSTANTACLLVLTYSSADTRWEGAYTSLPT